MSTATPSSTITPTLRRLGGLTEQAGFGPWIWPAGGSAYPQSMPCSMKRSPSRGRNNSPTRGSWPNCHRLELAEGSSSASGQPPDHPTFE